MTVRMKKKPIKEGYKFYALCDASTGFVYCFVPDGLREKFLMDFVRKGRRKYLKK
jgi:hypothetical protein